MSEFSYLILKMKNLILSIFLLSGWLFGQDLSGRWIAVTTFDSGYYAELFLVQNDTNVYAGHCYDTEAGGFCRHWLDASFNPETQELIGMDMELIQKSPTHEPTDYILKYEKDEDGNEFLVGTTVIIPYEFRPQSMMRPTKDQLFQLRFRTRQPATSIRYMKVSDDYEIYNDDMPLAMSPEQILLEKSAFPEVFEDEQVAKLHQQNELQRIPENLSFYDFFDLRGFRENRPSTSPEIEEVPEVNVPSDMAKIEEMNENNDEIEEMEIASTDKVEIPGYEINEEKIVNDKASISEKRFARTDQLLSHIRLQSEKVTLLIMDYGTIDNDTVTIFYNNEIIADAIRLTDKAAEFELEILPHQRNELVFVANNLGDVPPNTARITIISDERRYNYRLFTDEQNNALVLLENVGIREKN